MARLATAEKMVATPLHVAAHQGNVDTVKTLIAHGYNVNGKEEEGLTPLHYAAIGGNSDVVKILVKAGSKIDEKENQGMTPLHCAAREGKTGVVKALVKAGSKVDEKDDMGMIPLHCAAVRGMSGAVKALVEAKSNVNQKDKMGVIPLHCAAQQGDIDVVNALIMAGSNVNEKEETGLTPLHIAAVHCNVDVVNTLVRAGSNVNEKDESGMTPLHRAAHQGNSEVVKALIKAGSKVDEKDKKGYIPLHYASVRGDAEMVKALVEAVSKVDVKDKNTDREGLLNPGVPQAAHTEDRSAALLPSGVLQAERTEDPSAASLPPVHNSDSGVAYDYDDESQEAVQESTSAPMDVMAQLKNDDSISATITWKMPKDMQNADQCYEVFYLSEEGIENSKEARGSECSLKNLEPDKTYTITVGILKKPIRSRSIKITTKQHFKYDDIALDMSNAIGKGASGTVYRSKLHGKDVAAKVCLQCNESELKVLSMVRHENIVEFLGFAQSSYSSVYVMELAETSLHDYVHDKTKPLDYKIVTRWAMDIANGVYYLHFEAMKPKHLVHCDLKSRNVLIFKGVCKICDFGSMKDIDATRTTTVYGTLLYRPPEYYTCPQYEKKAYCASDVFSYGLTLWEMLKRQYPHGNKKEYEIYQFYKNNEILADNDQWPSNLKLLYRRCCSYNIKERPTFEEIRDILSSGESTATPHSTDEGTSDEIPDLN